MKRENKISQNSVTHRGMSPCDNSIQRDCASPRRGFSVTGFAGQMCGNSAVDDAQHLAHDGRLAGKQKAQRERYTEYPLTHGLMR